MKFIINEALTTDKICEILQRNMGYSANLEKLYSYYIGKHSILNKHYTDDTKPCNKTVTNFCHNIVQQYQGYNIGIPVTYEVEDGLKTILNYNDVTNQDNTFLKNGLIFGKSYELHYIDEDKVERFAELDPRQCVAIYDNTVEENLLAFVRFYPVDTTKFQMEYYVEVYTDTKITTYKSNIGFSGLTFIEEQEHHYGQVPVVVFTLNEEEQGIFEQITSLQDTYNTLLSGEVDDFTSFTDAMLVLTNITCEKEDIVAMKENRVILLPQDATAEYLTKSINDTQIENLLDNVKELIYKITNAPDFTDDKFLASTGIALRLKLIGFENTSKAFMNRFEKALRKRIELISKIESIKGNDAWVNVRISFTPNIPTNSVELAQEIGLYRGLVSDETLLGKIPFIEDVQEELSRIKKQNEANMSMYQLEHEMSDDDEQ